MAIHYDPRLYTAGTAVFNPQPITQATAQVAAYKKAKNDALENYYKDNIDKLNTSQIRPQDAEGFNKQLGDLKMYYLTNKEKLKKGDVNANMGYDRLWQKARNYALTSKDAAAGQKEQMDVGLALKKEGGTVPDSFMTDVQAHDLPISDPNWKRFNAMPYVMEPAPFDIGKELKNYEDIKRTPGTPVIGETDQKSGKRIITTTESFDPEAKGILALRAASSFQNNRSFQREVNKSIENPGIKQQLDEVYKNQFGKEPEDKEDYAAAYVLSQKQLLKKEEKIEDDKEWAAAKRQEERMALEKARQRGRIALEGLKQGNRMGLLKARAALKGTSKDEQENALDVIFKDLEDESKKPGNDWTTTSNGVKTGSYKVAPISPTIKKQFIIETTDENGEKVISEPTHIGFNPDGTVKVIYTTGEKGGKFGIDKTLTHNISKNEFKAMVGKGLGLGVKTTAEAKYSAGDDDEDIDEEEEVIFTPTQSGSKPSSTKKKIPGF